MNNTLYVAWRAGDKSHGKWGPVGRLERVEDGYRFGYTRGATTLEGFQPFPGMEELDTIYESDELFPLFANRLLSHTRPEYEAFLTWSGFETSHPPDPIALLGVTEGRRATDAIEVFPRPVPDANGCYVTKFFLHGVRWMDPSALERIGKLRCGDSLAVMLDVMNRYDPDAVAVRTQDKEPPMLVGYVPRYLARDIRRLCQSCETDFIRLAVERVNVDAPMQHRLLCRMAASWPERFRPCDSPEFEPLVGLPPSTASTRTVG